MDIDIERMKLLVLKEINLVIRQKESDKKKTLTVGDVMDYVQQATVNVYKAEKLLKKSSLSVSDGLETQNVAKEKP